MMGGEIYYQLCSLLYIKVLKFQTMAGMGRWIGRVALVTGASTGIGAGICRELVKQGLKVVGCARNYEQLSKLAKAEDMSNAAGRMHAIKCDLANEKEIYAMFDNIRSNFGRIDVCINNAGFSKDAPLLSSVSADEWRSIMEVNVIALSICSKEAVKLMQETRTHDGQIIQIDCINGRRFPEMGLPGLNFYCATKSALNTLTEGLRREIRTSSTPHIRVASITPGAVETEFAERSFNLDVAKSLYSRVKCLQPQDIAEAVTYILQAPERVEVNDIILQPVEYTI